MRSRNGVPTGASGRKVFLWIILLMLFSANSYSLSSDNICKFGGQHTQFNNSVWCPPNQVNIAFSTNGNSKSILGRVIDEIGNPIKGIRVSLDYIIPDSYNKTIGKVLTNENGEYRFDNLSIREYGLSIRNPEDRKIKFIIPEKHAFEGSVDSPALFKSIELKDADTSVEINWQLVLGVNVEGKITFEDGTPVEKVVVRNPNGWGTECSSKNDGSYSVKGLLVENNAVMLKFHHNPALQNPMNFRTFHSFSITPTILATAGATIKKDIQIRKIDPTKISIKGKVYVEGVLYAPENKEFIKSTKFPPDARMQVAFGVGSKDKTSVYGTFITPTGNYECYNITPGKYQFHAGYIFTDFAWEFIDKPIPYREGPINGETEIEILPDATAPLTIDINFVVSPTERMEFIRR